MDLQELQQCCHNFAKYPQNLSRVDLPSRRLKDYKEQVDDREEVLFSTPEDFTEEHPDDVGLEFWDLHDERTKFSLTRARSLDHIRPLCSAGSPTDSQNTFPRLRCRFLFLYAENSRERLYLTREMLMLALSYHQVQPWFLEFLFPFGEQDEPHDFRFSSFRHKTYTTAQPNLALRALGRSGQELHLCYNLKTVERSDKNRHMPWSTRQTVVYHSFDTANGQALWLILKGNNSMSQDLKPEADRVPWQGANETETRELAFASSLLIHLQVCRWACENWRPYINEFQKEMDGLTKQGLRRNVTAETLPTATIGDDHLFHQSSHSWVVPQIVKKLTSQSTFSNNPLWSRQLRPCATANIPSTLEKGSAGQTTRIAQDDYPRRPPPDIKMSDLQRLQKIEEDASSALYYLRTNIKIVKALQDRYAIFPDVTSTMQDDLFRFDLQLQGIVYELEMHESSLESLVKLSAERKNLLFGILEFQNMQASKILAHKAQISAERMETMTRDMQGLTEKTTKETVSMSVIAGVTMFFLPGTFVSTLMSTDILQWNQRADGSYQMLTAPGALHIFLELTLPLMTLAFLIWALVSWQSRTARGEKTQATQG